jgi:hypothetical protein
MRHNDPNLAFTLRVKVYRDESPIIIRAYDGNGWDSAGRVKLITEVRHKGRVVFPKGALYCALHGSSDGVQARELVLSLVSMRPGDTDADYFDYSPAQLDFARTYGEALSMERDYRYCDDNGNCAEDWAHLARIKRARAKAGR